MATVVVVSTGVTRVDDGEAYTGYANIGSGGGGSAEPSYAYQGTNLANRQITTTASPGRGLYYDPTGDSGTAQDMTTATGTKTHWMVKAVLSDYGDLDEANEGAMVWIGSDASNVYTFDVANSSAVKTSLTAWRTLGGMLIVPINPNESGYRGGTTGSPALGSVDYFGYTVRMSAGNAKSENMGLDAIDLVPVGGGLVLTRGDAGSTEGDFADFLAYDQGTTNNRWGFVTSDKGIYSVFGTLIIGDSAGTNATEFIDTATTILYPDGLFSAGFTAILVYLSNANDVCTLGGTHTSLGTDGGSVNTRADLTFSGTSGAATLSGTWVNFRNVTLTSGVTVSGADIECQDLTQGSADVEGDTVIRPDTATQVALCDDGTFGTSTGFNNMSFVQAGSGHALEFTTTTTRTFTNVGFSGFGGTPGTNSTPSSGANDAAIYNNSGGALTINIAGGDTPSVRNAASSTTTVTNTKTLTVTVKDPNGNAIEGARVRIEKSSDESLISNGSTNASGVYSDGTYAYTVDTDVNIDVRLLGWLPFEATGQITTNGLSVNVTLQPDKTANLP